jgi:hypothetical protein
VMKYVKCLREMRWSLATSRPTIRRGENLTP